MNQELSDVKPGKPGIVIVAAILNFLSTTMFYSFGAFSALAIVFGAAWGIDKVVAEQMSHYAPNPNYSYGIAVIFGMALVFFAVLGTFFLFIGIGLLRGKKFAWYLQVAMSTIGLLSLPVGLMSGAFMLPLGAVLNIVILVMFFQARVRAYFGV